MHTTIYCNILQYTAIYCDVLAIMYIYNSDSDVDCVLTSALNL